MYQALEKEIRKKFPTIAKYINTYLTEEEIETIKVCSPAKLDESTGAVKDYLIRRLLHPNFHLYEMFLKNGITNPDEMAGIMILQYQTQLKSNKWTV